MERQRFKLAHENARWAAIRAVSAAILGCVVEIHDGERTPEQNDKIWPMLRDISEQVEWYGQHLTPEEWKDVFTAALKRQKIVPGIDGGFVMVGGRTSKMSKSEISEMIELMYAFGAEHNIQWTER